MDLTPTHSMTTRAARRAFGLIDLMIAVAIVGILMVVIIPSAGTADPVRLISAATTVSADIEYAQSATLAEPGDATIVRFDAPGDRYWLARESDPDTPIAHPVTGDPYLRVLGASEGQLFEGVEIQLPDGAGDLVFDDFGRLEQVTDYQVRLFNAGGDLFVVVAASTGSTSIVESVEAGSGGSLVVGEGTDPGAGGLGAF